MTRVIGGKKERERERERERKVVDVRMTRVDQKMVTFACCLLVPNTLLSKWSFMQVIHHSYHGFLYSVKKHGPTSIVNSCVSSSLSSVAA